MTQELSPAVATQLSLALLPLASTPKEMGLPYDAWLQDQQEMVEWAVMSKKRFVILDAGLGRGKSVVAVAAALVLQGKRVAILTTTKNLQDQYEREFSGLGLVLIKGRNEFVCNLIPAFTANVAPCSDGFKCPLKAEGSCDYFRQKATATTSRIYITNMAYFLTVYNYADGLGQVDVVIVDEADLSESWLLWMAGIRVSFSTFKRALPDAPIPRSNDITIWKEWAKEWAPVAGQNYRELEARMKEASDDGRNADVPQELRTRFRQATIVLNVITQVLKIKDASRWVVEGVEKAQEEDDSRGALELKPIWVSEFGEPLLWRFAKEKVVLMSGTIPNAERFAKLVGIPEGEWDYREYGCVFPIENRPFYYIPTIKVHYKMTSSDLDALVARIDHIIEERTDRKGIIHTGSYWLAREIYGRSMWGGQDGIMVQHRPGGVEGALQEYLKADVPKVLVSPALGRGISLAGAACSYVITARVPWPSMDTEQMKARMKEDKDYAAFVAAISVEQGAFRAIRGPKDVAENFMLDEVWRWFRVAYKDFFSEGFREAWVSKSILPKPLALPASLPGARGITYEREE